MSRLTIRLDERLRKRAEREARRQKVRLSELIRVALGRHLGCEQLAEMPPAHRPRTKSE